MRYFYLVAFLVMAACIGCQLQLKPAPVERKVQKVQIERYDKIETQYLTTGDYGALQQMNTDYPVQTRTLIENVLRIGRVDEIDINSKFYDFYQDSTLQLLLIDVQSQYEDLTDIDRSLSMAFSRLHEMLPQMEYPQVYTQVTALDQSIVVGNGMLGVSLDKYLGENHPLYLRYGYSEGQRRMMTRDFIVPDCISFYLLSLYEGADMHQLMPKIQYVVNRVMDRKFFDNKEIAKVEKYMNEHQQVSVDSLLTSSKVLSL